LKHNPVSCAGPVIQLSWIVTLFPPNAEAHGLERQFHLHCFKMKYSSKTKKRTGMSKFEPANDICEMSHFCERDSIAITAPVFFRQSIR
jgi:hypothetical protein